MTKSFANADGGDIVLGIEDDGRIVGVDNNPKHLNELLRAPLDYCVPSINVEVEYGGQRGSQTRGQRGSQTDYRSDGQIGEIAGLSVNQGGSQTGGQKGSQTTNNDTDRMILDAIIADPSITRLKLSELIGISPATVQKHINKLKKLKIIARRGGDFGGHWKILRKE